MIQLHPQAGINHIEALEAQRETFIAIRQTLHANPETCYEEHKTSALVAQQLESYGLEVHRGMAGTGVIGVLRSGSSPRMIGLRADMDALNINELTGLPYRSTTPGKMHACGHDGHTTMLLMAAQQLSATRNFDGTVVFIFQPAEEGGGGARVMIQEGLFEQFPVESVYAMHNIPGIAAGTIAVMPGPMMAAGDLVKISLTTLGGHAAMPNTTPDPIVAGSELVLSLQTLISRVRDPLEPVVLSITKFQGGEVGNAIPARVDLQGTVRSYDSATRDIVAEGIKRVAAGIATSYGLEVEVAYQYGCPATINTAREAIFAQQAFSQLLGSERVLTNLHPLMTSEDFAFMLQARPGAYIWIGNGDSSGLHTPLYNFNDEILTTGAAAWVQLAEAALPEPGA